MGRKLVRAYRRSATPHPKGCGVPALLMFGFLYDQIRNGNTYEEGCDLGQPPHCICTNASRGLSAIAVYCANVLYVVQSLSRYEVRSSVAAVPNPLDSNNQKDLHQLDCGH